MIRRGLYYKKDEFTSVVDNFTAKGMSIEQMSVIDAGWHCSWCFQPQGIRAKLLDAPNSDFPRFGDVSNLDRTLDNVCKALFNTEI